MQNRIFFSQAALDAWLSAGLIDLTGTELMVKEEGRAYRIADALYVTTEVASGQDPNDLVGRVRTRAYLEELGAEIVETSMILGDSAYDVVPGYVGAPSSAFEEHRKTRQAGPDSDEALLLQLVKPLS